MNEKIITAKSVLSVLLKTFVSFVLSCIAAYYFPKLLLLSFSEKVVNIIYSCLIAIPAVLVFLSIKHDYKHILDGSSKGFGLYILFDGMFVFLYFCLSVCENRSLSVFFPSLYAGLPVFPCSMDYFTFIISWTMVIPACEILHWYHLFQKMLGTILLDRK